MTEDPHFLDNDEVTRVFAAMSDLIAESDRGAVLICTEFVDDQLGKFFRSFAPPDYSPRQLSKLLNYPGPLSTLAARSHVAALCGLLSKKIADAIDELRQLRNEAAHSSSSFRLRDHKKRVHSFFDFAEGGPMGFNRLANEMLVNNVVQLLLNLDHPIEPDRKAFDTPREVLDWLSESEEVLATLNERLPRAELCIGTGILCGTIVYHRERRREGQ